VSILDKHSRHEKCQQDIVDAFKAHDRSGHGVVPAAELRQILTQFGDKMSTAEGILMSTSLLTCNNLCSYYNYDATLWMLEIVWQPCRVTDWRQSLFCCCTASMEQVTDGAETTAIDRLVSS